MSTLSILTFSPQISWSYGGSTATLRIKYSANFTDSFGRPVLRGLFKDVACTIAGSVLTVPQFDLITTNDALVNPLVTCSVQFIDSSGAARDWLFQNFSIPQVLTPSASIGTLFTYNQGSALVLPPEFYLSRDETTALVTTMLAALGFGPATNLVLGMVLLSVAAADPANPRVWGHNDPLVRDALKLMGVELDATVGSPADTNVVGFDAVSGKYIAQATAVPSLHASSHEDGGTDEINVGGLSGLLADAQTPLAHAASHEDGGSDEINVTDLSGLLADAQTPLAHAASHENGGSDEISVAGLSGLLDDPQTPLGHHASHEPGGSDTLELSAASRLFGRGSAAGAGDVQEIELGSGLTMTGTTLEASGTGGYDTVEDEGTPLAQRSTINFEGAGVTAADSGGVTVVTIPGGGGGASFAGIDKFMNV